MNNLEQAGVLVVDDEKDVCFLLCSYLRNNGIKADYCLSLEEGRRHIELHSPHVLLLDINLKDGNGLSLLEEKVIPEEVQVIVMSAQEQKESEAIGLGAREFIAKPFKVAQVIATIKKMNPDY